MLGSIDSFLVVMIFCPQSFPCNLYTETSFFGWYRQIFHDVTLRRLCKNWSIMAASRPNAGDHFYYKHERNIVLQVEQAAV